MARNVFFLLMTLVICASCKKDDVFTNLDPPDKKANTYPFKKGSVITEDTAEFNFIEELFGYSTPNIIAEIEERKDGRIEINGFASNESTISISFDWGDGSRTEGWFPQEHIYTDINRNYYVIVTANYGPIQKENTRVFVRFVPPEITQIPIPSEITVTIPDYQMILGTRLYNVSGDIGYLRIVFSSGTFLV